MPSLWLTKTWWEKLLLQYFTHYVYSYNLKKIGLLKIKIVFSQRLVGSVFLGHSVFLKLTSTDSNSLCFKRLAFIALQSLFDKKHCKSTL